MVRRCRRVTERSARRGVVCPPVRFGAAPRWCLEARVPATAASGTSSGAFGEARCHMRPPPRLCLGWWAVAEASRSGRYVVGEDWMRAFERYVGIGGMVSTVSALDSPSPGKIENAVGGLMRMIICKHWRS